MMKPRIRRYKNEVFLKALGRHCRSLRQKKGYSIDRLAKESDQLSAGTIDRIERGLSDSQVLALYRYAEVLDCTLLDIFAFLKSSSELSASFDPRITPFEVGAKAPPRHIPVYPLRVAAGKFSNPEDADSLQPLGWVEVFQKGDLQDFFAAYVSGESMEPRIKNGDLALFKKYSGGSRQGHIFLIQARGLKDVETGEAFVVKKYHRITAPRSEASQHPTVVHLLSENPKYPPIILMGASDEEVQVLAEFIRTL